MEDNAKITTKTIFLKILVPLDRNQLAMLQDSCIQSLTNDVQMDGVLNSHLFNRYLKYCWECLQEKNGEKGKDPFCRSNYHSNNYTVTCSQLTDHSVVS